MSDEDRTPDDAPADAADAPPAAEPVAEPVAEPAPDADARARRATIAARIARRGSSLEGQEALVRAGLRSRDDHRAWLEAQGYLDVEVLMAAVSG